MSMPSPSELLVILAIVLLLFGAKRLPEIARGFGEAIREFKKSIREDGDESIEAAKKKTDRDTPGGA